MTAASTNSTAGHTAISASDILSSIKIITRAQPLVPRMDLVADPMLTVPYEDWSRVRSAGRARRRRRLGHRQNIVYREKPSPHVYEVDGVIVAHPETINALMGRIAKRHTEFVENEFFGALRT